MAEFTKLATEILRNHLIEGVLKFNVFIKATFYKGIDPGQIIQAYFNKGNTRGLHLISNNLDIEENLDSECQAISDWVELYAHKASNFILKSIDLVELTCHKVSDMCGGAGRVVLPPQLSYSRSVINIEDAPPTQCFKYAILAAIHNKNFPDNHRCRASNYDQFANEFNFQSLIYPVNSYQILAFEKSNPTLSVSAHILDNNLPRCLYKSRYPTRPTTVHLFLHSNHWMPIVNFSLFYKEKRQCRFWKCEKCFKSFYHQDHFDRHVDCQGDASVQHEIMPSPPTLKFTDFDKVVSAPYVMYADIESIIVKLNCDKIENTQKTHQHKPIAIGNMIISPLPIEQHEKYVEFAGVDCMSKFINYVEELC